MRRPFACAVLAGSQVLRCDLPNEDVVENVGAGVGVEQDVISMFPDGSLTLEVLFYSPNAIPIDNVKWRGLLHCVDGYGQVEKDGIYQLDLGEIVTRRQCATQRHPLPFYPTSVKLVVVCEPIDASKETFSAQELDFVAHVCSILEDDVVNPRHGSLQLETVRKVAENCPAYGHIVDGRYMGNWCEFVIHHPDDFTVFNYTTEEIIGRRMDPYVNPAELRVVHKKGKRVQFYEEGEEEELVEYLKSLLTNSDLPAEAVLTKIHERGVGYSIAPAFSQLMRFLGRNKHLFYWSTNPSQVTSVGLTRHRNKDRHTGWQHWSSGPLIHPVKQ
ncbi:hypothetical protein DIPPA_33496 [Diplonema papillatum]|nr:hypothetical protein DIPPA_33496 [Diplonema papillatum]